MSLKNYEKVSIEFAMKRVRKWEDTYEWIPIFGALAAISTAFLAGANNLPAPFSTPVGSGALTLLKAFIMAISIYVPGAAFARNGINVNGLFSNFLEDRQPDAGFLMWSLVIVLVTAAIWLALATYLELPVSSQQSIQGALLGTIIVTEGFDYIPSWNKKENHNFYGGGLVWILLEWTVAPLIACLFAFLLFTVLKACVLRHENAEKRILVFLPIDYGVSAGLLCLFVVFQIIPHIVTVNRWTSAVAVAAASLIGALLSLVVVVPLAIKKFDTTQNYKSKKTNVSQKQQSEETQDQACNNKVDSTEEDFEIALRDFMKMRVLETVYEEDEKSWPSPDADQDTDQPATHSLSKSSPEQSTTPFKELLQFSPNRQTRKFQKINKRTMAENASDFIKDLAKSTLSPATEYDRQTLIRHALAEKYDEMEDLFSFPHLLASCIFALIQSASEVAAVVGPYGAIHDLFSHRASYSKDEKEDVEVMVNVTVWWFRAIGGFSAAVGFFLFGWRLSQSLGGKLSYISNSRGLASQLSTVAAILVVSLFKLPVSCVHAFVGSLVGVGIADDPRNVNWKLLLKFVCGWVLTLVFCCGVAYVIFSASVYSPAYVVP